MTSSTRSGRGVRARQVAYELLTIGHDWLLDEISALIDKS